MKTSPVGETATLCPYALVPEPPKPVLHRCPPNGGASLSTVAGPLSGPEETRLQAERKETLRAKKIEKRTGPPVQRRVFTAEVHRLCHAGRCKYPELAMRLTRRKK